MLLLIDQMLSTLDARRNITRAVSPELIASERNADWQRIPEGTRPHIKFLPQNTYFLFFRWSEAGNLTDSKVTRGIKTAERLFRMLELLTARARPSLTSRRSVAKILRRSGQQNGLSAVLVPVPSVTGVPFIYASSHE